MTTRGARLWAALGGLLGAVGCAQPAADKAGGGDTGASTDGAADTGCPDGAAGTWYEDLDRDGHGDPDKPVTACDQPDGAAPEGDDCDDLDPDVSPSAEETCNGVDDDCDGEQDEGLLRSFTQDLDRDGYGDPTVSEEACDAPAGAWVEDAEGPDDDDCDDDDADVNPAATEVCADGLDNDCDGVALACALSGGLGVGDADAAFLNPGEIRTTGKQLVAQDLDGDGIDDLAIASPRYTPAGSTLKHHGAVRVAYGSAGWGGEQDVDALPGWRGEEYEASLGYAMASADLDGDGAPDLLAGAMLADTGANAGGAVYLFAGGGRTSDERSAAEATAVFLGDQTGQRLQNVGTPGDFDGDGDVDLLLGDWNNRETAHAWLLLNDGGWSGATVVRDTADAVIEAEDPDEYFAYGRASRMGAAGDLDGDGTQDLYFGNPAAEGRAGELTVLLSENWADFGSTRTTEDFDLRVTGSTDDGFLGSAAWAAGDLDGDGSNDLLVAALTHEPASESSTEGPGRLWLVSGEMWTAEGAVAVDVADVSPWWLAGTDGSVERLGRDLVFANVNGDDHPDLVVSTSAGGDEQQGTVAIFSGPLSWSGSASVADADATLTGPSADGFFGYALAAGDFNGDGVDDLAVGAHHHGYFGPLVDYTEGGVWVFFGSDW